LLQQQQIPLEITITLETKKNSHIIS
jgi:hypothetical protein